MLVNDIVIIARRILGDVKATQWTNERMLDIVNSGLRDINRHVGVYRNEHFFELQPYRFRYPLPTDLLEVTSLWYNGEEVNMFNQNDKVNTLMATKDQLNRGVLELKNLPTIIARDKRFFGGPTGFLVPQPEFDLWSDSTWNNTSAWREDQFWGVPYLYNDSTELGVVSNPLLNPLGVTNGAVLPSSIFNNLQPSTFGLLSDVHRVGDLTAVSTSGEPFGVLTAIGDSAIGDSATETLGKGGTIGTINGTPYRIAGRYGTVVSVLKGTEHIQVRYKALTQPLTSLEVAFPLSAAWLEPMVNWIVGTALQDDNDANNKERAIVFLGRYSRDLELEKVSSNKDYSRASKKYETKYIGGIR